jgi:hypothetical protein
MPGAVVRVLGMAVSHTGHVRVVLAGRLADEAEPGTGKDRAAQQTKRPPSGQLAHRRRSLRRSFKVR